MLGIGCGAMIFLPSAQLLISHFVWRSAYAILGLAVLIAPLTVVAEFLKENLRYGLDRNVSARRALTDLPLTAELFHRLAFFILSCKPISYCRFKRIDVYFL
jgi:hypothetical protein